MWSDEAALSRRRTGDRPTRSGGGRHRDAADAVACVAGSPEPGRAVANPTDDGASPDTTSERDAWTRREEHAARSPRTSRRRPSMPLAPTRSGAVETGVARPLPCSSRQRAESCAIDALNAAAPKTSGFCEPAHRRGGSAMPSAKARRGRRVGRRGCRKTLSTSPRSRRVEARARRLRQTNGRRLACRRCRSSVPSRCRHTCSATSFVAVVRASESSRRHARRSDEAVVERRRRPKTVRAVSRNSACATRNPRPPRTGIFSSGFAFADRLRQPRAAMRVIEKTPREKTSHRRNPRHAWVSAMSKETHRESVGCARTHSTNACAADAAAVRAGGPEKK